MKLKQTITLVLAALSLTTAAQERRRGFQREAYATETPMVHDPVMAREGDTYYIYATGMGIQQMTSRDRKTWTVLPQPVMTVIPGWTTYTTLFRSTNGALPLCEPFLGRRWA